VTAVRELAAELGSDRAALGLLALRAAEGAGFLSAGTCATLAGGPFALVAEEARRLRARTSGALPPWPLPARARGTAWRSLLAGDAPAPEAICSAAEELTSRRVGERGRRSAGLYYTPPDVAALVVSLALRHGVPSPATVLDPCAGAGAFLCAAARALSGSLGPARAVSICSGADLDADALRAARAALLIAGGPGAAPGALRRVDSLRADLPLADLLVSNPPYGHVESSAGRAALLRLLPALRGGEIDRYAAFLLRSLALVRPGGTCALLIPDTWMTNARSGRLRAAVLDAAEIAAVCDLGKPFAAARDTRVQGVILVRRQEQPARRERTTQVLRGRERLAGATAAELRAGVPRGWQLYRSVAERRLCSAIENSAVPLSALCEVGYGVRTGDNARFVARRPPRTGEAGLAGGEDVLPYALRWKPKSLVSPTPPLAELVRRQLGRPRIAVQRIRTNSTAPHARWLEAAPVPSELVCLDSLSTLCCADGDRLWALLAVLGSVALQRYHRLQTTDVNVKPASLRELPAPRALLDPAETAGLARLARARSAEAAAETQRPHAPALERAIDAEVYRLFALPEDCVAEAERGFWGPRFAEEYRRLEEARQTPSIESAAS
jgi:predicted RNA methylase